MAEENKAFVVQKHVRGGETHWDLMLEKDDFLLTFRVYKSPKELPGQSVKAVKIFDHPKKFLTYEGTVNKGKGSVQIADKGTFQIQSQNSSRIEMILTGRILKGCFTLNQLEGDQWQFAPATQ